MKIDKFKLLLPASCFKEKKDILPVIKVNISALVGADQDKLWVGVLRELTGLGYFNQARIPRLQRRG